MNSNEARALEHAEKLARRELYRLTGEDEQRIRDALAAALDSGRRMRPEGPTRDALVRIGAHAIGCSTYDLRASELAWIGDELERIAYAGDAERLERVRVWSQKIHGNEYRHAWCMATARAMLAGDELPHERGYSRSSFTTGRNRRETITRLMQL